MELPLYVDQERRGSVEAAAEEGATAFTLHAPELGAGMWRIVLEGDQGEVLLAITDTARLHRRLSWQLLSRAGTLRRARASRLDAVWQRAGADFPAGSFVRCSGAGQEAAIPWAEDRPFPREEWFCFASLRRFGGQWWVCYCLDGEKNPVFRAEN